MNQDINDITLSDWEELGRELGHWDYFRDQIYKEVTDSLDEVQNNYITEGLGHGLF